MRNNIEIVFEEIPEGGGICKFKKYVINWAKIDIFYIIIFHMFEHSPTFHFGVDGAIAPRSQGKVAFTLDDDLAVVEEGRQSTLREEHDGVRIVPEIVVLFEEGHNLFVIHLAGHKVPFDETTCVVYSCFVFH